jgi:Mce-associated membrane protein
VSKHSKEQTGEAETTVTPTDTKSESEETSTEESVDKTEVSDEVDKADEPTETADETSESAEPKKPKRSIQWTRVFAFGVLPAVALLLALGAGYLKWMDNSVRNSETARIESVQTAKDSTIALLSYKPDTVEQQLGAARDLLTGDFRDSYTSLTNDVVIPGAKQKQISAVATVPAVASVSAKPNQAVVLVFVNQTVIVGQDAPTDTASSVRVTLDKVGDRWLIAKFDPV